MEEKNRTTPPQEHEIDLMEIVKKFWEHRRFILKVSGIGALAGIIIAFSIPKEYTTTVILAPESGSGAAGNMGALASMVGINIPTGGDKSEISPELYPNIVSSTPFLLGLLNIPVADTKRKIDTSLYSYLQDYQRGTWWGFVFGLPGKLLSLFASKQEDGGAAAASEQPIRLSGKKNAVLNGLSERITVAVDKKTGVITLSSTMQSPEISALIADTVVSYLQAYVISYRTQKARLDLAFTQTLYDEAQTQYYLAQQNYAGFQDENLGVVSARYATRQERFQNEMNLAFSVYNQMAQQLQLAKVKVQNITPVYTIIQPPVIPLKATSPKKMIILVGCLFLALIGACGWIYIREWIEGRRKS
jgi:uncharacterized protein involved in exopolysaccharide biosynthesis